MAEQKHTAGPWEARFRFGYQTTVSGRQRYPICDTAMAPLGEANRGRDEANARLIAAAPDGLKLAKLITRLAHTEELSTHIEVIFDVHDAALILAAAEAIIAKAEGQANG